MVFFGLFRDRAQPRPLTDGKDSGGSPVENGKHNPLPSPRLSPTASRKRHTPPPTSDRTAAMVAQRWKAMPADGIKLEEEDNGVVVDIRLPAPALAGAGADTDSDMESTIVVTGPVAQLYGGGPVMYEGITRDADHFSPVWDGPLEDRNPGPDDAYDPYNNMDFMANRTMGVRPSAASAFKRSALDILDSIEEEESDEGEEDSDSDKDDGDAKSSRAVQAKGRRRRDPDRFVPSGDDEDEDEDYSSDEVVEEDDDELQNWDWLFEAEPPLSQGEEDDKKWAVDPAELQAYADGVVTISGYKDCWTADERRLHRLLSLRGFHPLLPAAWSRDFLGVPMYPSLFAPLADEEELKEEGDEKRRQAATVISNYGSQFHATRALRALFDLQARVSSLRQAGGATHRIGGVVERELRRYIAWAAADSGLDRCAPFVAMPNIAAKEFQAPAQDDSANGDLEDAKLPSEQRRPPQKKKGNRRAVNSLARQVQDYFHRWVQEYRAYYAALPAYPVLDDEEGDAKKGTTADDNGDSNEIPKSKRSLKGKGKRSTLRNRAAPRQRQLRPPRLLYGFIIVQHAVMLLVVDASATNGKTPAPRCFAEFNLSLGDHWLDASLNVAIPVHLARAAQLRSAEGLALPTMQTDDIDEDV